MHRSVKQNIKDNGTYFLTMTVVDWLDVFTRKTEANIIIDALSYCIHNKGLNLYAYCIMSNHLQLIANCNEPFQLKDTIRDFKKHTSRTIISEYQNSRQRKKKWMLAIFHKAGLERTKNKHFKVWQDGNHAIELYSEKFTWRKVNYIHQNPVKAGLVRKAEDWVYSSAANYADLKSAVLEEVSILSPRLISYG